MNQRDKEYERVHVEELVLILEDRIRKLETALADVQKAQAQGLPHTVEYRIGKLYVKELSGTLNIGITSIGEDRDLTDLSTLQDVVLGHDTDPESESWYRDEGWFDVGDVDD